MNPVREWDWKGGTWLLGALLLLALIYQLFGAQLQAYRVPISMISLILLAGLTVRQALMLWRKGEHRTALVKVLVMAVLLVLPARSLLVMLRS
ncbi:hypothetical protein [Deinococcus navajonensis]|uniref:Uncharacterized protein n=1 Tax=Deinococcus navajonensis TaxID=309884 RepID=A0ABV8XKS8_9DEIO